MSLQIAILRVLSSYPGGRASVAELKRDLAILNSSGPEWTQRMRRLAARVPDLDLFANRLVLRDETGWQLTEAGREILTLPNLPLPVVPEVSVAPVPLLQTEAPAALPPRPLERAIPARRPSRREGRRRRRQ
ncbi:hypothetical protein H8B02_09235 [Bradyrhizobium sp. Pear77]|uniref:hypothetical protein n=1 Tax=Bradyrhizobium altum TaxID=1571202 RepID=UPI001E4D4D08|nr:hypothetical protein [Bradyrhizobium altum]MCC8953628.1 hypothetical protein [Bradyrhizobium altum]